MCSIRVVVENIRNTCRSKKEHAVSAITPDCILRVYVFCNLQYPHIPAVGGGCQPGSPAVSCRTGPDNLDHIQALPGKGNS